MVEKRNGTKEKSKIWHYDENCGNRVYPYADPCSFRGCIFLTDNPQRHEGRGHQTAGGHYGRAGRSA